MTVLLQKKNSFDNINMCLVSKNRKQVKKSTSKNKRNVMLENLFKHFSTLHS